MNNSKIVFDNNDSLEVEKPIDRVPWLRSRELDLIKIIEAIDRISETQDWKVLKEDIFDNLEETLEKRLMTEARKDTIDPIEIAKLNGQLLWAKKYSDLKKLKDFYRLELSNIRKQLQVT